MRKLIALCALLLSSSAAIAQTDKAPAVTKLPGEEKLSVRERAERDFLMPIRHKKMAEVAKVTASAEQDAIASPELDATAHYTEAAEAHPEEVAAPAHTERHTALRHRSSPRHHSRAATTTSAKHNSKAKRHAKAEKTSSPRSHKKAIAHKTKTKTKKSTSSSRHQTAKKKSSSHRKHRR